jgi:hypothetical protein
MKNLIKTTALALAASGITVAAAPVSAAEFASHGSYAAAASADTYEWRDRDRYRDRNRNYDRRYSSGRYGYGEPVYRDTRVWRGNDGRTYCRKKDGTTGLIIGGAAGALLGREIDGGHNRTLGTILGAAAGALIGKEIDGGTRCN